uniref:lipocalin family protein n=1 Tax=Candidatus Electronema sp. TaxID=2698783 RepID=UPI00405667F7
MKTLRLASALLAVLTLGGCLGMPNNVSPVSGFEIDRYLGKWHEIARLDHSFERGMERVTAEYTLREDGGVAVRNRGFLAAKQEWKEAEGKAFFVGEPNVGYLKVSFFGPFYGSYVIFELDKENYQYAFVSGPDHSYLWLLSRHPVVEPELLARFAEQARKRGFDTSKLIYVRQQP